MRKVMVLLGALLFLPFIAGLYGALHDQISYSVSPEYFTLFKYEQFGFEPQWFGGHRPTVAVIGFLATWWVGALIAVFLGGTALLQPDARAMRQAIVRGTIITLGVVMLAALIGLVQGFFFFKIDSAWFPEYLHRFSAVGNMHNFSYGGGVLGLIVALTDMEWRRISRRAAAARNDLA